MSRESWPIREMWPGETGVIVATGPSLDLAQIRLIARARLEARCRVFAVNDAVYPCWFGDWLHACDAKWWNWHRTTATKFDGIRTTTEESLPPAWARYLKRQEADKKTGWCGGFAEAPDTVATGGNSGYQTIQCAAKAGCGPLVLVGFDMSPEPDGEDFRTHYFGDHEDGIRSDYTGTMLPFFPTLVEPLAARGIEVVNATPGSAIDCFPKARLEDVI